MRTSSRVSSISSSPNFSTTSPAFIPAVSAGPSGTSVTSAPFASFEADGVGDVLVDVLDAAPRASRGGSRRSRAADRPPGSPPPTTSRSRCRSSRRSASRIAVLTPITSAGHVEERAAGVAAVDRRVGLDEVVVGALQRAVARRDDAGRDREALAERVADRQHPVADARGVAVAELRRTAAARRSRPSGARGRCGCRGRPDARRGCRRGRARPRSRRRSR